MKFNKKKAKAIGVFTAYTFAVMMMGAVQNKPEFQWGWRYWALVIIADFFLFKVLDYLDHKKLK